jgi:hypothetical protein
MDRAVIALVDIETSKNEGPVYLALLIFSTKFIENLALIAGVFYRKDKEGRYVPWSTQSFHP